MGKLNVIIVDATGNKEQKVGLPDDIKIGVIMVKLVEKIKLPSTGPDGNPISYKFIHKVSGRQLLETQTLADAHIKDGDVLRLQPEITAGAICSKCGKEMQDGIAFCTDCGQSMNANVQNVAPQPQMMYNAYNVPKKDKTELIKLLGFIGAGVYAGSGVIAAFMDYSNDLLKLMYALTDIGAGLFMVAIVFYMLEKLNKNK